MPKITPEKLVAMATPQRPRLSPTPEDLSDPQFIAIWNVIKGWDIEREPGAGYAGANGSDVMAILEGILTSKRRGDG